MSPDFVLTAAHCFTYGDLPRHIVVEIDDEKMGYRGTDRHLSSLYSLEHDFMCYRVFNLGKRYLESSGFKLFRWGSVERLWRVNILPVASLCLQTEISLDQAEEPNRYTSNWNDILLCAGHKHRKIVKVVLGKASCVKLVLKQKRWAYWWDYGLGTLAFCSGNCT